MKIRDGESTRLAEAKRLWKIYTRVSKRRHIEIDLTLSEFINYCENKCYYCHKPPLMRAILPNTGEKTGIPNPNKGFFYNALVRIVINKGLTKGNIRTACKECAWMKSDLDEKDFYIWLDRIYKYQHRFDNNGDNNGTKRPT